MTIISRGGALSVTGRVIGFDGTYLQIESPYGPLTLNYAQVTCSGTACPNPQSHIPVVRMSGAAQMADVLIPALIDGYARAQGWRSALRQLGPTRLRIELSDDNGVVGVFSVHGTTSDEGFADLIAFQSDMALSTREVSPTELALGHEVGLGALDSALQSRIVGLDALVPVISAQNNVGDVSLSELAGIMAGAITDWGALGGNDAPITLHLGSQRNGQVQFLATVLGAEPTAGAIHHDTTADMAAAVARDPDGLGIGSLGETGVAAPVALSDACGFISAPRVAALKAQDYPLTAPLFIYLPEWRLHPVARGFLSFLRTPAAQLIVRRAGFVDQGAVPVPLDAQGQRFVSAIAAAGPEIQLPELQRMVRILTALTRQSVSFRFEVGSTRLDAGSRSNLTLLAQRIKDGAYAGRALWLVGFSDGRGDALANSDLSSARAEAVKSDLLDLLGALPEGVTLETEAFGEALPMGCDDTEWGRQMNRRVELWVSE
ncbi:phosphate ABC transporter substrate-binding/OmpA family protein [Yoonia sp. R2331]|uniref:phosphate ABC transporter substrate-binding/OmpA family protein n=1 Tax=Yoonia sp. R2331 TaxID=3237238 RepID=UPI0034E3F091